MATSLAGMLLGCTVVGAVGQVAVAHARVDTTADLAALAVAARLVRGEGSEAACEVGVRLALADDTRLTSCAVTGQQVVVSVEADIEVLGVAATVTGRARAGPVGSV